MKPVPIIGDFALIPVTWWILVFLVSAALVALLVVSLPYVALLIFVRIYNIIRPGASLLPSIQSPFAIRAYFLLVLIFWITRNVFGF